MGQHRLHQEETYLQRTCCAVGMLFTCASALSLESLNSSNRMVQRLLPRWAPPTRRERTPRWSANPPVARTATALVSTRATFGSIVLRSMTATGACHVSLQPGGADHGSVEPCVLQARRFQTLHSYNKGTTVIHFRDIVVGKPRPAAV